MYRPRVVFSASEGSFSLAARELAAAVSGNPEIGRLGLDVGWIAGQAVRMSDIARMCESGRVVFVRHLMGEVARLPVSGASDLDRIASAAAAAVGGGGNPADLALQVWASGPAPPGLRPGEVWDRVAGMIRRDGVAIARSGRDRVLAVCITPGTAVVGLSWRRDCLADWPGGRVRLAREEGRVSRAEFKLEEAVEVFGLSLPRGGDALDLGASPGGWTRIMRRCGLAVWAVDPGDLHPRVVSDRGVRHARTTAGRFVAGTRLRFDLVANDMRMDAGESCAVMLGAARLLRPEGLAVMTLKLSMIRPLEQVRRSVRHLERAYRVVHLRQLFHNRNEVMIVARPLPGPGLR